MYIPRKIWQPCNQNKSFFARHNLIFTEKTDFLAEWGNGETAAARANLMQSFALVIYKQILPSLEKNYKNTF
jgi:hypothetical protein